MNLWISIRPSRNRRFEILSAWSTNSVAHGHPDPGSRVRVRFFGPSGHRRAFLVS